MVPEMEKERLVSPTHEHDDHDHHDHEEGHSHIVNVKKVDRVSPTQIKLTIEIPFAEVSGHEEKTARKFLNAAKLPGFRPGKAPMKMVREKYKDEIHKEVVSHLVEAGLYEAFTKTKHMPVNRPKIDFKGFSFEKKEPLTFEAEFEVQPEIELRDYKGIKLTAPKTDVADDEVQKSLEDLRERLATLEPVEGKGAEKGLFAVVDIAYGIGGDPADKTKTKAYTVEVGTGQVLKELDEALLTMKVGEERDVKAAFPADYHDKELAGKDAVYFCRLSELKKKVLPAIDENFANQLRAGSTLEQIRKEIRENLEANKKSESDKAKRRDVLAHLVKQNQFSVASSLVEQQMGRMAQWMEEDFKRRGFPQMEWKESDIQSLRAKAEEMVRGSLLLKEIALKENISLDEKLLENRINQMAGELNRSVEETRKWLNGRGMLEKLKDEVVTDQVYDFLLNNAEVS